jgi:hypothetical protein
MRGGCRRIASSRDLLFFLFGDAERRNENLYAALFILRRAAEIRFGSRFYLQQGLYLRLLDFLDLIKSGDDPAWLAIESGGDHKSQIGSLKVVCRLGKFERPHF